MTELVLNLHHRPETLAAVLGDGSDLGAHVRYSWEQPRMLGSAGGPRLALPIIGADPFFIVNGDTLTDVDLGALSDGARRIGCAGDAGAGAQLQPDHYGGVRLDDDGAVTGFAPRGPSARGTFHFIGVQVVSAGAFQSVARGTVASSIGEVYDRLIAAVPAAFAASSPTPRSGTSARSPTTGARRSPSPDRTRPSLDSDATSRSRPARR